MKVSQLKPQPENPRTITPAKSAQLKKTMLEFGDISGVVFNRKTGHLVGGHRRNENFDHDAAITYVKKYKKPTRAGTVAEGFVVLKGERFAYREVSWPLVREKLANIAANKHAGEWNLPQLGDWMKELGSFDLDLDLELTGFDADEIAKLPSSIDVAGHSRKSKSEQEEDNEDQGKPAKCKRGELYDLGGTQLRCGRGELHFCDKVVKLWQKYSGEDAILITSGKASDQGKKQASAHA